MNNCYKKVLLSKSCCQGSWWISRGKQSEFGGVYNIFVCWPPGQYKYLSVDLKYVSCMIDSLCTS